MLTLFQLLAVVLDVSSLGFLAGRGLRGPVETDDDGNPSRASPIASINVAWNSWRSCEKRERAFKLCSVEGFRPDESVPDPFTFPLNTV